MLLCASCSVLCSALWCRGQHLILCTATVCFALLAAFLCSALCCRGVSTLILARCLCCLPSLQRSRCTVLQRVSALILWRSCHVSALRSVRFGALCAEVSDPLTLPMFTCACRRFAAVHAVLQRVNSDPLAQLPMFVLRFCSVPLQCTVLQVSADPLAQLCLLRFFSVPLRCTVLRKFNTLILICRMFMRFLQRPCGALCCRRSASDPLAQLPMFALLLCGAATRALCCRGQPL
jgi:hypothetical protein